MTYNNLYQRLHFAHAIVIYYVINCKQFELILPVMWKQVHTLIFKSKLLKNSKSVEAGIEVCFFPFRKKDLRTKLINFSKNWLIVKFKKSWAKSGDFWLRSGDREKSSKSGVSRPNRESWQVCSQARLIILFSTDKTCHMTLLKHGCFYIIGHLSDVFSEKIKWRVRALARLYSISTRHCACCEQHSLRLKKFLSGDEPLATYCVQFGLWWSENKIQTTRSESEREYIQATAGYNWYHWMIIKLFSSLSFYWPLIQGLKLIFVGAFGPTVHAVVIKNL